MDVTPESNLVVLGDDSPVVEVNPETGNTVRYVFPSFTWRVAVDSTGVAVGYEVPHDNVPSLLRSVPGVEGYDRIGLDMYLSDLAFSQDDALFAVASDARIGLTLRRGKWTFFTKVTHLTGRAV